SGPLVVDHVNIDIAPGEFLTLLGPSGSGKTTTLNMIAGFTDITSGAIRLGGRDVAPLPPHRRDFGMVFQNYALFPHMTVAQNVAFPLRERKVPKPEIARRVEETLRLVDLAGMGGRRPTSCRAASSSGSPWPGPWSSRPPYCCSTSRSARST